jgi:hypothetical protein
MSFRYKAPSPALPGELDDPAETAALASTAVSENRAATTALALPAGEKTKRMTIDAREKRCILQVMCNLK